MGLPGRVLVALVAALGAVSIGACGDDDEGTGTTRPLVTFGRTADDGKTYGLVVEQGRGATVTQYPAKPKRFTVDEGELSSLRDALVDLNIRALKHDYQPSQPTAVGDRYSLTYQGTTVQAAERAQLPEKLESVIDKLDEILDGQT